MPRKNINARHPKWNLAPNTHVMYQTSEADVPKVVRYMGEQEDACIKVFDPEGSEFWAPIWACWVPKKVAVAA